MSYDSFSRRCMKMNRPNSARQIANELRAQINEGEISEGSRLPAVRVLAERYGVTRNTVTKAIQLLQNEGLVTTRHGSGAYVRVAFPIRRLGPDRYARHKWQNTTVQAHENGLLNSAAVTQQGHQTQEVLRVSADAGVANVLGVPEGSTVYARARVMTRDGVATHTMTSYYRPDDVEGTAITDPRPGIAGRSGGFQVLSDLGLAPHEITEDISARMPTAEESAKLDIPPGEPVVEVLRTTRTADGLAVEYARGVHLASRFVWSFTYEIPD
jgi:GntR family transcriptional regulator